jgi:hypothetical protein
MVPYNAVPYATAGPIHHGPLDLGRYYGSKVVVESLSAISRLVEREDSQHNRHDYKYHTM